MERLRDRRCSGRTGEEILTARGLDIATFEDWLTIDAEERALGASLGRARTKVATWDELTALALGRTDA